MRLVRFSLVFPFTFLTALGAAAKSVAASDHLIQRLDGSTISPRQIEETVTRLMSEARVTGLGLALLNDNKIVYVQGFGYRNKEEPQRLTKDTVMYGASFTKAVFAYLVMQLVAENILDLDRPVDAYLDKPLPEYEEYQDLKTDLRYRKITARMLLSHTSGFPNWRWINPDKKLDIKFEPGTRYSYSGEGIRLLQLVIEAITHQSVGDLLRKRVFDPLGMTRTRMTWDKAFEDNHAIGYDEKEQPLGAQKRKTANAAGSMVTTTSDYARFLQAVMQGKGLSASTKEKMLLTPQIRIYSRTQFPTPSPQTTEENNAIQLGYGLGWGVFQTPYGKAYFKEGHDDGWENHSVVFADKKIGIVLMSNSANGDSIFKELLETLIKDTFTPWKWEGYIPYKMAQ